MQDTPRTEAEKAQEAREEGVQAEYDAQDQEALDQDTPAPPEEAAEI